VDGRFKWLQEKLGNDVPRKAQVVLPTPEFFPDTYEGRREDAQAMFLRVAGYMNVDASRFRLFFYDEGGGGMPRGIGHHETSGSAGVHVAQEGIVAIGIEMNQLADPPSLVATMAHEIGHEILLGGKLVSRDEPDHEPLTDLITVFLGMGIFGSNATIRDRGYSAGLAAGWRTQRLGYLNQRTFGYALARFALARGETRPPWLKHVRPDVRAPLKQGIAFLQAAGTNE
jgi:hypothetical protein